MKLTPTKKNTYTVYFTQANVLVLGQKNENLIYEIEHCAKKKKHNKMFVMWTTNLWKWGNHSLKPLTLIQWLSRWLHPWNQRLSRACIVHLVIKRTNWSYVKTMSCSGSHLGITINIKNTKFVKEPPMIYAQFRFNQCNSFREEYISVFSPYGPVLILWPVVAAILDFRSA